MRAGLKPSMMRPVQHKQELQLQHKIKTPKCNPTFQTGGSAQSDIRLPALKHALQAHAQSVDAHALRVQAYQIAHHEVAGMSYKRYDGFFTRQQKRRLNNTQNECRPHLALVHGQCPSAAKGHLRTRRQYLPTELNTEHLGRNRPLCGTHRWTGARDSTGSAR